MPAYSIPYNPEHLAAIPVHLKQPMSSPDDGALHDILIRLYDAYQPLERVFVTCRANNDTIAINVYPLSGATYNRHEVFLIHAKIDEIIDYIPWSSKRNSEVYKETELSIISALRLWFWGRKGTKGEILFKVSYAFARAITFRDCENEI